jgi:hypothetical protein
MKNFLHSFIPPELFVYYWVAGFVDAGIAFFAAVKYTNYVYLTFGFLILAASIMVFAADIQIKLVKKMCIIVDERENEEENYDNSQE